VPAVAAQAAAAQAAAAQAVAAVCGALRGRWLGPRCWKQKAGFAALPGLI